MKYNEQIHQNLAILIRAFVCFISNEMGFMNTYGMKNAKIKGYDVFKALSVELQHHRSVI